MRRVGLRTLVGCSVLLLIGSGLFVPNCAAGDELDYGPVPEGSNADDQPPPKLLPDYAPRARFEGRFPWPTRSFGLFESTTTYGTACRERCMPEMFSPRGVGIARRTGCERMDYSPYVTKHDESNHGPSYYNRVHLFPCQHPHHCEKQGWHCGWSVYY
ncbi:MAG: hypothetical protein AB7Q45_19215 [Planctomycetaceae bacterium]